MTALGRRWIAVLVAGGLTLGGCSLPKPAAGPVEPSTSPSPSPSPVASAPASISPSPSPAKPRISKKALAYFFAIALGSEYGDKVSVILMWTKPVVTVRTDGAMTSADRKCLAKVISDFNALTATTDLQLTASASSDIVIHFAPVTKFRSLEPSYVKGNDGFFHTTWMDYHLRSANILIRTTGIGATTRCSLIREELTQSMGLMRDSYQYSDSIFYQPYSTPTRYSTLDKQLVSLLYSGALEPGDTKKDVTAAVQVLP